MPTAPATPRRRLQPADRRAEIVEAATRLIAERGYRGLTVQGVAEACDLTVAGVLHHMGTKDGILVAVLEHRDVVDVEAAQQLTHGAAGPREHLDAIMARNAMQPEIVRLYSVLGAESLDAAHPAHAYFQRRYVRSRAELAELLADCVDDPEGAAVQVLAAMDGLQLQWLRSPARFDLLAAWAVAADAILSRRHGD